MENRLKNVDFDIGASYIIHLLDAFNGNHHGFCSPRILQDGVFTAVCTICHHLFR